MYSRQGHLWARAGGAVATATKPPPPSSVSTSDLFRNYLFERKVLMPLSEHAREGSGCRRFCRPRLLILSFSNWDITQLLIVVMFVCMYALLTTHCQACTYVRTHTQTDVVPTLGWPPNDSGSGIWEAALTWTRRSSLLVGWICYGWYELAS